MYLPIRPGEDFFSEDVSEADRTMAAIEDLKKIQSSRKVLREDEMKALEMLLEQCSEIIKPGGRLVVISYHSLEDRLVKNFIAKGKFFGEAEKDFYGNVIKPFEAINRKPILASEEELKRNNRARSAKLRIAQKK